MTRALICTGVLGGGAAVVFALALAVSILFPQGALVPGSWNGGWAQPMFSDDRLVQQGWVGAGFDGGPVLVEPAPAPPVRALPIAVPVGAES